MSYNAFHRETMLNKILSKQNYFNSSLFIVIADQYQPIRSQLFKAKIKVIAYTSDYYL